MIRSRGKVVKTVDKKPKTPVQMDNWPPMATMARYLNTAYEHTFCYCIHYNPGTAAAMQPSAD